MVIKSCNLYQGPKARQRSNKPYKVYIPLEFNSLETLSADIIHMPQGFEGFKYLLNTTCHSTNLVNTMPLK